MSKHKRACDHAAELAALRAEITDLRARVRELEVRQVPFTTPLMPYPWQPYPPLDVCRWGSIAIEPHWTGVTLGELCRSRPAPG